MKNYRHTRSYENLQRGIFEGVGEYGIPELQPVARCDIENWISFNFAKTCEEPELHGVHFFIDDYQFERVWKDPDRYTQMLLRFKGVCTPDFSPYSDFPKAIQVYNHYRKHWVGRYWQEHGMLVIPTVTWSDPSTFEFCFDGEPKGGVVAVSSVSMFETDEFRQWLLLGYEEMMRRLSPRQIIWRGLVPEEFDEADRRRLVVIQQYTDRFDEMRRRKKAERSLLESTG